MAHTLRAPRYLVDLARDLSHLIAFSYNLGNDRLIEERARCLPSRLVVSPRNEREFELVVRFEFEQFPRRDCVPVPLEMVVALEAWDCELETKVRWLRDHEGKLRRYIL